MSCQAQVGLLFLRVCAQPVVGACMSCGLPLCAYHLGTGSCPSCQLAAGNPDDSEFTREAATRNQYYGTYGAGTQFGDDGYFNESDGESLRPGMMGFIAGAGASDDYDPFET